MPDFPSDLALSSLNGANGFRIGGEAAFDLTGLSVYGAGDLNGDGFADLVVGAPNADPNGSASGAAYVVFGRAGGFAASLNPTSLTGATGFRIAGVAAGDYAGQSVSSAGDLNGDGFDDLVIGAPYADAAGTDSGASYVVFGRAGGFSGSLTLSSLTGANGFRIAGAAADDRFGSSVSSAGDLNGDGFDDLIIGASRADPSGSASGASYVVFGRAGGFSANFALSSLTGANGFRINGVAAGDRAGLSVSSAGDVNGDGFDDLVVGAMFADADGTDSGAAYVVFGRASGFSASLTLSSLNGANGFRIGSETASGYAGRSVSTAGDINGDGFDDLVVGAHYADANGTDSGASYVVFGRVGGFSASLDLSSLTGANGFRIAGLAAGDLAGFSVSAAGDVNGDGFGDLVVGAPTADPNGSGSGASYVVFGRAGGFSANLSLSSLNGANGFRIGGEAASSQAGTSVSTAGDVNGDGFDDLVVGAPLAGTSGFTFGAGAGYVIFGRAPTEAVTRIGTATDNTISGGAFGDTLNGLGGADTLKGNGGNDTYGVDNAADRVLEAAGGGAADRVNTSVGFVLGAGQQVEILGTTSAAGTSAINLTGNGLAQTIYGNAGVNTLNGGGAADILQGFGGNDTYIVDQAADQVLEAAGGGTADRVNASTSYALAAGQQVEILGTTSAAGTTAINLTGNAFNQTVYGNAGANFLNGQGGSDTLSGFGGADTFSFTTALGAGNVDHIADFSAPADTIRLAKTIFSALSAGMLDASAYKDIGDPGASVDANDRILYDDDSGALYYDTNGSDAGGRTLFAVLDTKPATLTAADFVVAA